MPLQGYMSASIVVTGVLLAAAFGYLWRAYHERATALWFASWVAYAFIIPLDLIYRATEARPWLLVVITLSALNGYLLLAGTSHFSARPVPRQSLPAAITAVAWAFLGTAMGLKLHAALVPAAAYVGLATLWTGVLFVRSGSGVWPVFTGVAMLAWGALRTMQPMLVLTPPLADWSPVVSQACQIAVALGSLILYYERTRSRLRANEERFRLIADEASDVIFRFRIVPEFAYEYISPSFERVFGYTVDELLEHPEYTLKMAHPDAHRIIRRMMRGQLPIGEAFTSEWTTKDGRVLWIEQRLNAIRDSNGQVVAVQGVSRDSRLSASSYNSIGPAGPRAAVRVSDSRSRPGWLCCWAGL